MARSRASRGRPDGKSLGLQYGVPISNTEPGPRWRVQATQDDGIVLNGFHPVPHSMRGVHEELTELLANHGRNDIDSYVFVMSEPGERVQLSRIFYY